MTLVGIVDLAKPANLSEFRGLNHKVAGHTMTMAH